MWRDLRSAARALTRSLTFTAATTLALGLAIGSTGAIFGLVDALWLRPSGLRDSGSLVWVFSTSLSDPSGPWSWSEYETLRDRTTSFDEVAARGRRGALFTDASGHADLVLVNVVSTNFFPTIGVDALHGRVFGPIDEAYPAGDAGVVLGHAFWTTRFGADPAMVGRAINLGRGGNVAVKVVGVLPRTFRELTVAADRDVWMTPATWERLAGREDLERRDNRWFEVMARRRRASSVDTANAEVVALSAAFARDFPDSNTGRSARVVSEFDFRLERGGVNAAGLLALVLLVVFITCVNVANLVLARTADRTRELAVRVAIGATRRHLVRYLAAESLLLGCAGALFSALVTLWLMRLLPALMHTPPGLRAFTEFTPDARIMGFTVAVTAATTLLFTLPAIWTAIRADIASMLRNDPLATRRGPGGRLRAGLVVAQVAVSMVLVSSAAVLGRSFVETTRADFGFTREPVLTAWLSPVDITPLKGAQAIAQLKALPGVADVAVALRAPLSLSGGGMAERVEAPDGSALGSPRRDVKFTAVSASYFEVMDTRLIDGRFFTREEEIAAEPVVVVNDAFASTFFGKLEAPGRLIRPGAGAPAHRIVGVVQNSLVNTIGEPVEPYFYLPYWRGDYGEITFMVRTHGAPPMGLAAQIGQTLRAIDPQLDPRRGVIPLSEYIEYRASNYEATAALATGLAAIGLFLTAIGVYGVIAYRTSRRAREIGIRMALGAPRAQVVTLVVRDGVRVALLGLAIGFPAALAATRLLESILFGVDPWDATALIVSAGALCLSVGLATFLPAWRAAHLAPSRALREG
jgi:predicted permease